MWLALIAMLMGTPETCNSTQFGYEGDKYAGGRALHLGRPVNPETDVGIAHRTLPLGSQVLLHVPKRGTWTVAVVIDRGPYGRIDANGDWYNGASDWKRCRRKKDCYPKGSRWNGCADLTPRAGTFLSHDGWERIEVYPVKNSFIPRAVLLQRWGGNV